MKIFGPLKKNYLIPITGCESDSTSMTLPFSWRPKIFNRYFGGYFFITTYLEEKKYIFHTSRNVKTKCLLRLPCREVGVLILWINLKQQPPTITFGSWFTKVSSWPFWVLVDIIVPDIHSLHFFLILSLLVESSLAIIWQTWSLIWNGLI